MKQIFLFALLIIFAIPAFALNVKGTDDHVFAGILVVVLLLVSVYFFVWWFKNKASHGPGIFRKNRLSVALAKNKLYFPEYIRLSVRNSGEKDIDIDRPLLTFSYLFLKRKFSLKGINGYHFYPLLLEPGKVHDLNIELNHFYRYDAHLKKYPKVTVSIKDVNNRYSASKSVMLRKTLFR